MWRTRHPDKTRLARISLIALSTILAFSCRHNPDVPADPVYYDTQIQPVLTSNCANGQGCHGSGGKRFDFTTYEGVMSSGTVKGGKPYSSTLYTTIIKWKHAPNFMPKNGNPLPISDIRNIFVWILQGANDTTQSISSCDSVNVTYTATISPVITGQCIGCHDGSGSAGHGKSFLTYDQLHTEAQDTTNNLANNILLNAIKLPSSWGMPAIGVSNLSSCQIAQIRKWIKNGAPDN